MNEKFHWIFFDVGTTLVDEERAYNHRVYDMIKDTNITFDEFDKKGLENRLAEFGILKYFDPVIASEEIGVSKPSKEIFEMAVAKVNFKPLECIMIGDRLDNDIIPAKQIGMKTIWMKQGLVRNQDKSLAEDCADWIVNSFSGLRDIF